MSTQLSTTIQRDDKRTLVVVFLRGGADGLSLVVPREDDHYYRARPRLAVKKESTLNLDGTFGLHPHLAPLEVAWKDGDLAIIHAAGCEDDTRSHFEAQDLMEHGGMVAGGWLGRFLRAKGPGTSPLSAVALSPTMPDVLSGAPSAVAFQRIEEFSIGKRTTPDFPRELRRLYELETGDLRTAADNTFDAIRKIEAIDTKAAPANGATYTANDSFHDGLRQVAQLIRADVGLDAASVDLNGWDTHFAQELAITGNIVSLGAGLAAFRQDLGARMATTTVVVMSEFGRNLAENTSFGTDHGRGGAMFLMGGGVRGGRMLGEWRGLDPKVIAIEENGKMRTEDLPVWTNYRDALAPILLRHGAPESAMGKIFPDYALKPLPIYG
jgi:uncharacterized protein (DUF1501 family)